MKTTIKYQMERIAALERDLNAERAAHKATIENSRSNLSAVLELKSALAAEKSRAEDALRRAGAAEAGENRMRQECDRRAEWNADATLENRRLKDDLERERRKDTHRSGVVTGLQRAIALAHGHLSAK